MNARPRDHHVAGVAPDWSRPAQAFRHLDRRAAAPADRAERRAQRAADRAFRKVLRKYQRDVYPMQCDAGTRLLERPWFLALLGVVAATCVFINVAGLLP